MDDSAPHSAQVRAAATMLKFGRDSIELDDLAARVDDLEQAASEVGGSGPGRRRYN